MAKLESILSKFSKVKETLQEEKDKVKGGKSYDNPYLFKPTFEPGEERTKFQIRFLPIQESATGKPWVELRYHMFQRDGDNRFIKVIDPRSFDPKANNPIAERGSQLWKSDNVIDKENAKKYFAKTRWFTLIYVKKAPDSQKKYEGKVLLFEIGKQVFDKMDAAINDYDMAFWDPSEGTDMLLVLKQKNTKDKWPDYTDSAFVQKTSPISTDAKVIAEIEKALDEITVKSQVIDRDGIKSGSELRELMYGGLKEGSSESSEAIDNTTVSDVVGDKVVELTDTDVEIDVPAAKVEKKVEAKAASKPAAKAEVKPTPKVEANPADDLNVDFSDEDFK